MRLFHVSDDPAITLFEPRPSPYATMPVVWAVDADHLANYLLPRDCPRVCFWATPSSTEADIKTLLGNDRAVIAIEVAWLDRVRTEQLTCYDMPTDSFTQRDVKAGYWVSQTPVVPLASQVLSNLPQQIASRTTALRALPSLWELHAAVTGSSLAFSMIRMRNAAPLS